MKRTLNPLLLFTILFLIQILSPTAHSQTSADLLNDFKSFKGIPTDSLQVSVSNRLADKYIYNHPDSSILFGKTALHAAKKMHLTRETAKAYNNIARTHYVSGSYFESLTYADSALNTGKKYDFKPEVATAINTRGVIYLGQNRLNEAIPEFSKALLLNEALKDSAKIAANYFNIGLAYDELGQFENAFLNLKKALLVSKLCKDGHLNQMSLNRIGEIHYHSKNYQQALRYYRAALDFKAYQDNWEKGFAYSGMAQTLYEMKQHQQALEYATKSFVLMKEVNADWDTERAANILSKCYAALENYQKAYEYQSIARAYGDSILNEKKEQEINYLHLQDKKAENLALLRENENSRQVIRNNRIVISITVLFSLLLLAALFLLRRNINRKNALNTELKHRNDEIQIQKEEIQAQREELISINKTKDRVLSVIGHDLRSPFASVRQVLDLIRSGDLDEHEQEMLFDDFQKQITLVSELIDGLLAWASSQQSGGAVNYEKISLTDTTEKILSLYKPAFDQKKQQVEHTKNENIFIEADENHVRIILQNIVSNAIKFTPQQGTVSLFYTKENDFVAIHIKDDGLGMSKKKLAELFNTSGVAISENGTDMEPGTGLGLLLIKQFVEENKGHIEVKSEIDKGSEFIVYFKASQTTASDLQSIK
ncbi:tetratricopeptide repeat-containing sensor histidine kinase [Dyadobacter psychrotolerans]|uniref:histidine kinase n=1 Tax=Dyadobacter psychrotolerans TaxID=2541721 RepID=A0A4R5DX09_9BACT|nr:tetratricopeptide repeat-containing sensor histidine kinase [Dyadobacter psychrotolerans]TDE15603.1 sensor histidine kinase [Dyadobacter psychrotolerans]